MHGLPVLLTGLSFSLASQSAVTSSNVMTKMIDISPINGVSYMTRCSKPYSVQKHMGLRLKQKYPRHGATHGTTCPSLMDSVQDVAVFRARVYQF